jgi:hypothetical protein
MTLMASYGTGIFFMRWAFRKSNRLFGMKGITIFRL